TLPAGGAWFAGMPWNAGSARTKRCWSKSSTMARCTWRSTCTRRSSRRRWMQRKIELYSFGYGRSGPPPGDVVVFDCRKLPNPHNDTALRWMDGRDMEVRDFVLKSPKAHAIITSATVDALQHGKV